MSRSVGRSVGLLSEIFKIPFVTSLRECYLLLPWPIFCAEAFSRSDQNLCHIYTDTTSFPCSSVDGALKNASEEIGVVLSRF